MAINELIGKKNWFQEIIVLLRLNVCENFNGKSSDDNADYGNIAHVYKFRAGYTAFSPKYSP